MKRRSLLIIAILIMCIGFAAISTTLVINGNTKVGENTDDFFVIFTKATLNGTLTVTLEKSATEEVREKYVCTLTFNAVERDVLGVAPINLYNMIKDNADTKTVIDYKIRSGVSGTLVTGEGTTANPYIVK